MFGHQLHSRLDLLKPSMESHVEYKQQQQIKGHDQHARERQFSKNQILIQASLSPNRHSLNVVIRSTRDTPLKDSCDSHCFLLGERNVMNVTIVLYYVILFLCKLFMHACVVDHLCSACSLYVRLSSLSQIILLNQPLLGYKNIYSLYDS